jgi:hypothetical protein
MARFKPTPPAPPAAISADPTALSAAASPRPQVIGSPNFDYNPATGQPNLRPGETVGSSGTRAGIVVFSTNQGRKIFACSMDEYEAFFGPISSLQRDTIAWQAPDHARPSGWTERHAKLPADQVDLDPDGIPYAGPKARAAATRIATIGLAPPDEDVGGIPSGIGTDADPEGATAPAGDSAGE